jgi:acyl carrier protein
MPTPPTLKEDLRALIAEVIEKDVDVVGDDVLLRDLGVDSMQAIEIISDIERRYQIKIAESEFKNISTLANVHRFVDEKLSAR